METETTPMLTLEEIYAAERLWNDGEGLKKRYDNDLNAFLHHIANQVQGRTEESPELAEIQGR